MSRCRGAVALAGCALAVSLAAAVHVPAAGADAARSEARGDSAYAAGRLPEARAAFEQAIAEEPERFGALVRLARTESDMGEDASGEEQRRLTASAVEHARTAVKVAPDSARGHLELAVALGRQALHEGAKTRLAMSREIKSEVDRAIQLDSTLGRAYHVRGTWNRKLARLNFFERLAAKTVLGGVPPGASMDNALRDFEKAVELEPEYVHHRLELGRTCMEMKLYDQARVQLEKAIDLPPTSSPRDAKYQQEARELLARLPK